MNLMHSGLFFVLFILLEAISGLTPDNSKTTNRTQDLPSDHTVTKKSQQENGVSESVKIIASTLPQADPKTTTSDGNKTTSTTPVTPQTTTSTPSPTPAPSPAPTPANGPWVVRNNITKTVCIIAEMSMQLNITYPLKNNSLQHSLLDIPKNSTVNGNCTETTQSLLLHWGPGHSLQINFSANKTAKFFYVSGLSLYVNAIVFKDVQVNDSKIWHFENKSSEFMTSLDMSYKCNKMQDLNLKSDDDERLKAVLSLKDTQFEAFMNKTEVGFEAAQNCDTFDTPDIVPIAVGCALAILVLVVLVAYLIGRKRSQNRGYLSM